MAFSTSNNDRSTKPEGRADTTSTVAPQVQQSIDAMNAGWRNEVATALGMDHNTFQLAQGTLGLQSTDSSGLFQMADAVPPRSSVAYYDPSSMSKRSNAYNQLLHAMRFTATNQLPAALGPMYASWIAYRNADNSTLTQEELFRKWAERHLDPGQLTAALTAFKAAKNDPLNTALDNFANSNFQTAFRTDTQQLFTLPTYSCSITVANQAINRGASASINFKVSTANTSSNGTTVSGSASGFYDIFSGGIGGSFEQLNQKAASSDFEIHGTINKYATVEVVAADWYDGAMVRRAWNAKDDHTVWDPDSNMGDWDSFFGDNGSLARRVSQLLLVSDYNLTVTSKATYSESDFLKITANASFGIWPFFSASASAVHTKTYSHNEDGSISVSYRLDKGDIAIWGGTIQSAPQ